jgi:hypothetical protein
VKVCATSFDPPPNPQKTPCVTSASAGRVLVTGDLCPIDARDIAPADFAALDGDVKDLLTAASEHRLFSEGTATSKRAAVDPPTWVPLTPVPAGASARRVAAGDRADTATVDNVAASLSSLAPDDLKPQPIQDTLSDTVKGIDTLKDKDAQYALDQIYVASGAGMVVNGVRIQPQGGSLALLVPSDVKNGLTSVKAMTINARSATSYLGPPGDAHAIPLDDPGAAFKKTLNDAKSAGESELKSVNLDALRNAASALNLGPFKLGGDAHVTLNDDGTATLKAFAELPGLKAGPGDTSIRTDVTLTADLQGRIHLQGIHFKAGLAYLGAAKLQNLEFTYDQGTLDIKGEIDIPPPASAGIEIKDFRLAADGPRALSVDYVAGPGGGIPVGPGVYLTRIGGGFDRDTNILNGDTTVSVGPSLEGGCPTAGIRAQFNTHLAEQFYLDVTGQVQVACIPLVNVKFHADQTGLVTLDGGIDWSAGPLFIKGGIGGAIRLPNWQLNFNAKGGIRHIPVIGTVDAGLQAVLSNRGLAACASIEILGVTLGGGAAEPFHDGRPPLSVPELIGNLKLYRGCGISKYYSVVARKVLHSARAGSSAFTLPAGSKPVLLSIEGAGGAPRVILHGPGGQTFDYTDATGDRGKMVGASAGSVIEAEDRTVIILAKPTPGNWTAEVAAGSPAILRIQKAGFLPKPKVRAKVLGHGPSRVLKYDVAAIAGQSVRFVEQAKGGQTSIKTVKAGGKGKARFTVSEAKSPKRTIEAQVVQDDIPRATLVVARFTAASPHVGAPRHLRVRRSGRKAIVTWRKPPFARGYEVTVAYGVGRIALLKPKGRATRVVVRRVQKGEGLRVGVVAFSPAGHRSRVARTKLSGNMHVGSKHKKKRRTHRRRAAA